MKFLKLEKDILEWIAENNDDPVLKEQITRSKPVDRKLTGMGIFLTVVLPEGVPKIDGSENDVTVIPGPCIRSSGLAKGADSAIYISHGVFDTLEIFSLGGDFPEEIASYELYVPDR